MMTDPELRELLRETCSARPGQEARSWKLLQARIAAGPQSRPLLRSIFGAGLATAAVVVWLVAVTPPAAAPLDYASAESQAPGIYATSFYSKKAHAQVLWLNGLKPATDAAPNRNGTTAPTPVQPIPAPLPDPRSVTNSAPQAL